MRICLVIAALSTLTSVTPAHADSSLPPGWTHVPPEDVTVPAGALCPFALHIHDLEDQVITDVLATFRDGSPRSQIFVGELITQFTNVDTGASVTRNLSGDGLVRYGKAGSASWTYVGPAASAFFPGGPLPPGLYVVDGLYVIDYAADGTQTMPVHEGPNENLCATLSAHQ